MNNKNIYKNLSTSKEGRSPSVYPPLIHLHWNLVVMLVLGSIAISVLYQSSVIMMVSHVGSTGTGRGRYFHVGAKPVPCYNQIRAINDRVVTRLQCIYVFVDFEGFETRNIRVHL